MRKKLIVFVPIFAVAALATTGLTIAQEAADSENAHQRQEKTFTVDVAIDGTPGQAVFNLVGPNGSPGSRGDTLVAPGTIYPAGTLPHANPATNTPDDPGGIGKILCRGAVWIPFSDLTTPGPTYITELYMFDNGRNSILADGLTPNLFQSMERPVLGGTGHFRNVSGQLHEENLGFNKTGGCNLRVTFKLTNAGH
jgi:hypothetical protein